MMITRILVLVIFALSVALPAGAGASPHSPSVSLGAPDCESQHAQGPDDMQHHGAPATPSGDCGDCAQMVFCCAHVSMTCDGSILGKSHVLGAFIIIGQIQRFKAKSLSSNLYHPPKAL